MVFLQRKVGRKWRHSFGFNLPWRLDGFSTPVPYMLKLDLQIVSISLGDQMVFLPGGTREEAVEFISFNLPWRLDGFSTNLMPGVFFQQIQFQSPLEIRWFFYIFHLLQVALEQSGFNLPWRLDGFSTTKKMTAKLTANKFQSPLEIRWFFYLLQLRPPRFLFPVSISLGDQMVFLQRAFICLLYIYLTYDFRIPSF